VCDEVSALLTAVAADFLCSCWYLEIHSDNRTRHVPRCVRYYEQVLRLETFQNFYVGSGSRTPELYSVGQDWFEYCFIHKKFAVTRRLMGGVYEYTAKIS
jgi:hypothetical protein